MKKKLVLMLVVCLMTSLFMGSMSMQAKEPGLLLSFETAVGNSLVGENGNLDIIAYSGSKQAAKIAQYNIAWANRIGGCGIKLVNLNLPVGVQQNQYLVLKIATDDVSRLNAYDKTQIYYWGLNDPTPYPATGVPLDAMSALYNATALDFQYIVLDLSWTGSFTLTDLRLDIATSALDKTADPSNNNGYCGGYLYLKSAAFLDTMADVNAYINPQSVPSETPSQTPSETPSQTPSEAPSQTPAGTPERNEPNAGTGDMGLLYVAMILLCVSVGIFVVSRKKKYN